MEFLGIFLDITEQQAQFINDLIAGLVATFVGVFLALHFERKLVRQREEARLKEQREKEMGRTKDLFIQLLYTLAIFEHSGQEIFESNTSGIDGLREFAKWLNSEFGVGALMKIRDEMSRTGISLLSLSSIDSFVYKTKKFTTFLAHYGQVKFLQLKPGSNFVRDHMANDELRTEYDEWTKSLRDLMTEVETMVEKSSPTA